MKAVLCVTLASLACASIGCAPARGPGRAPVAAVEQASTRAAGVPFELLDGRPYVQVRVNGRGPYRFIVDTGGANLLTSDLAADLGLATAPHGTVEGAGEAREKVSEVRVSRLDLGDARFTDERFLVLAPAAVTVATGVPDLKGMIGYPILSKGALTVDYARHELAFAGSPPPADGERIAVPFFFDQDHTPTVSGSIDGVEGKFLLDTGDRSSVTLFGPFADANGIRTRYAPHFEGVTGWGVGGPVRAQVARAGRLTLGGLSVQAPVVRLSQQRSGSFATAATSGSVGYGILCAYRVTFDYRSRTVLFDRALEGACPESVDRAGLWLNPESGHLRVMDVWHGGPAEAAGIREGDLILAIDGKSVEGLPAATARQWLRRPAGTPVKLSVQSTEGVREIEIVLRDLV
jgi:predicted aspartyl protease